MLRGLRHVAYAATFADLFTNFDADKEMLVSRSVYEQNIFACLAKLLGVGLLGRLQY